MAKKEQIQSEAGKLILVSLPLGNLQDITFRSLETLKSVDYILAEDTREIIKFAHALETTFPHIKSYRDQIHERIVESVLADLESGKKIALVSDRGTPTISDPGYLLVRDVKAAGYEVTATPGASAVITALSISGLPTDRFTFLGFLPRRPGRQKALLQDFLELDTTLIMYESPFRILSLLKVINEVAPEAQVCCARELTKMHEEVINGTAAELSEHFGKRKVQGEFVVLVRQNS
jgi:16S rRNA (cytidine1402-2'-O)-methyltransferase